MENAVEIYDTEFVFNLETINLDDLKQLYTHFQIEDFGDSASATDKEAFFACFVDGETDGNHDAFLLIRLAAMISSDTAILVSSTEVMNGKEYRNEALIFLLGVKVDFDGADYLDFVDGHLLPEVIHQFDVNTAAEILKKYDFMKPL